MSKILIVEDDENILELEKDYIEASNMEALGATNGNDNLCALHTLAKLKKRIVFRS